MGKRKINEGYVIYAETTVPGAGSYSVMAEEWSGMRWYIKQNKKRKWSIKLDMLYTDGTENASARFSEPSSMQSKDGGVKFKSTFLEMGAYSQNQTFDYTIDVESDGSGDLVISDVTV